MNRLHTLISKINADFAWRFVQIYLKEGAVFLLFLLSVKILLPAEFGLYSYITSFAYFFILIGDFGISATTAKLVTERKGEGSNVLGSIFVNSFIAVVVLSLISLLAAFIIGSFFLGSNLYLLYYVAPTIVLSPIASFYDGYYRGLKRFRTLSLFAVSSFIVFAFSSVWLVFNYGLLGALFAQNVFYATFILATLFAKKDMTFRLDPKLMKELIHYSVIVGVGSIGYFLFTKIDVVILGKFGYLVEAAYYDLITKIFSLFIITFSIFGQVIAPYLIEIRLDKQQLLAKIAYYRKLVIICAVITALISILVMPLAVSLFLPKYFNSTFLTGFAILGVLLPFDLWAVVQRQGMLVPLGLAGVVTLSTIVGGVLNVVSDIVLINTVGFIGVFISTFIIHVGVLTWQDLYLRRKLRTL